MMSRPRLVPRPQSVASQFPFVAPKPALSGQAGERYAECVDAQVQLRGNMTQLVLSFETADGETGRMWVQLQSPITSTCRYWRLATLALGDETPAPGKPVHPKNVFIGKFFRAHVAWRTDGKNSETSLTGPKDAKDFLRVVDLLERTDPWP